MTEKELAEMLRNNPDLVALDGTERLGQIAISHELEPGLVVIRTGDRPKFSEHELQAAVIAECDRRSILRVEYRLIFAIPNGGHRHPAVAAKLKAEGVKPGVLDLLLPVARQGYHGYFIELKCGDNKPSQDQEEWIRKLRAEGYKCDVVWDSVDRVMGLLEAYLEGRNG